MNILAIETSTEICVVALQWQGKLYLREESAKRLHNKRLLPMLKAILAEADAKLVKLDAIAFGAGPGSFVGIRIAAGVVQGLAFAHSLPVIAISSLRVLAQAVFEQTQQEKIIIAIDARMNSAYYAEYTAIDGLMQVKVADKLLPITEVSCSQPELNGIGQALINLAKAELQAGNTLSPEQALPAYLQDPV